MITSLLDLLFRRRLHHQTTEYLRNISSTHTRKSRDNAARLIEAMASKDGPKVVLGSTEWDQPLAVPLADLVGANSMVVGSTGSGKSRFGLQLIKGMLYATPPRAFALVDPKFETYVGTLDLVAQRLKELRRTDPEAAQELRERVVILDFSSSDRAVSEYNILSIADGVDSGFFAEERASLLTDLLPAGDSLSLAGTALLRHSIALCAELKLPIIFLTEILNDGQQRSAFLSHSQDQNVKDYFHRQFENVPRQTVAALSRRLDAFLASDAVRVPLGASAAPDMRAIQDESRILLVNTFGRSLSRNVRKLLQAIVFVDFSTAIFARRHSDRPFFFLVDEAADLFVTEHLRDHLRDCTAKARSFGTQICLFTQTLPASLSDPQVLSNIGWSLNLRCSPEDASFLRPVLPVTGRKLQPQSNPFEEARTYSINDERSFLLGSVANLPNRQGYIWLRGKSHEAIKITTQQIDLPHCSELDQLQNDPTFGKRISRAQYEHDVAARNKTWRRVEQPVFEETLKKSYKRMR